MGKALTESLKSQLVILLNRHVIESQPVSFEGQVDVWYWQEDKSLNLTVQSGHYRLVWMGQEGREYQMILETNSLGIEEYYNTYTGELDKDLKSLLESLSSMGDFHFDYEVES